MWMRISAWVSTTRSVKAARFPPCHARASSSSLLTATVAPPALYARGRG